MPEHDRWARGPSHSAPAGGNRAVVDGRGVAPELHRFNRTLGGLRTPRETETLLGGIDPPLRRLLAVGVPPAPSEKRWKPSPDVHGLRLRRDVAVGLGVAEGAVADGDAPTGELVDCGVGEPATGPRSAMGRLNQNPRPIATTTAAAAPARRRPRMCAF